MNNQKHLDENADEIMMIIPMKISLMTQVSLSKNYPLIKSHLDTIYYNRGQSKQEHPQIIYIHGCGTTSLVHALAEEHNFKV